MCDAAGSAPSLAPGPPHRLGVRVWAFFVFGCQPAICHSERSDALLNQSRGSAVGCAHCIHVSVCVWTWNCVCACTCMNMCAWRCEAGKRSTFLSTGSDGEHMHCIFVSARQGAVFWVGWVSLLSFFFFSLNHTFQWSRSLLGPQTPSARSCSFGLA